MICAGRKENAKGEKKMAEGERRKVGEAVARIRRR